MSIPAAVSLMQDITFYYAISTIVIDDSRQAILTINGLAMIAVMFFARWLISKVYTSGMLVSLLIVLSGAGFAFGHGLTTNKSDSNSSEMIEMTFMFWLLATVTASS